MIEKRALILDTLLVNATMGTLLAKELKNVDTGIRKYYREKLNLDGNVKSVTP